MLGTNAHSYGVSHGTLNSGNAGGHFQLPGSLNWSWVFKYACDASMSRYLNCLGDAGGQGAPVFDRGKRGFRDVSLLKWES